MANEITENVKSFYIDELNKYEYSYRDTKEDTQTFWMNPGSSLSKRIKASILYFTRNGKLLSIVIPPDGNNIRLEIDSITGDEKLFSPVAFIESEEGFEQLRKELKKDLMKAGVKNH